MHTYMCVYIYMRVCTNRYVRIDFNAFQDCFKMLRTCTNTYNGLQLRVDSSLNETCFIFELTEVQSEAYKKCAAGALERGLDGFLVTKVPLDNRHVGKLREL